MVFDLEATLCHFHFKYLLTPAAILFLDCIPTPIQKVWGVKRIGANYQQIKIKWAPETIHWEGNQKIHVLGPINYAVL